MPVIDRATHGSYTLRELLFASAHHGLASGFLPFDEWITQYSKLVFKQFSAAELIALTTNVNATREAASPNRSGLDGFKICSHVAISSNVDAKAAHQINAERLAHHDARFFLLPCTSDDFIATSPPNVMEMQHALRVRGTFVAETSKTKLLDLLEKNRSLLIFPADFTRAAEAPGKINARANADEPHNPAKHTKLFAEGVRSQAMLADVQPSTFSWDDIVRSAPFSESEELELLSRLSTVESFFAGNDYMAKQIPAVRTKYASGKSVSYLQRAVEEAEVMMEKQDEADEAAKKAAGRKSKAAEKAARRKKAEEVEAAKAKKKKKKKKVVDSDISSSDDGSGSSESDDDEPAKKKPRTMDERLVNFFGSYTAKQEADDEELTEIGCLKRKVKVEMRQLQREHSSFPWEWHPRLSELRDLMSEQLVLVGEMEIGFRGYQAGSPMAEPARLSVKQFQLQAGKTQEEMDRYQSAYELHLQGKSMRICEAYLASYRESVSRLSETDKFHKKLLAKAEKKAKLAEKDILADSQLESQKLMTETLRGLSSGAAGGSSSYGGGTGYRGSADGKYSTTQPDREWELVAGKRLCKCIDASYYDKAYSGCIAPPLNFFNTHPRADFDRSDKGISMEAYEGSCALCGKQGHRISDCGANGTPDTFMRDGKKVLTFRHLHGQKKISGIGKKL